ncbi:MAG: hypothetical protein AAFR14_12620 [Bacteroidota bacterium]
MFSFEAIGLDSVDVEIFQIYEDNMLQFLQEGGLNEGWGLERVGKIVHQSTVGLNSISENVEETDWNAYQLDLSSLLGPSRSDLYQVRIGFRPGYASKSCNNASESNYITPEEGESIMQYRYGYPGYDYEHESDPCYPAYYNPDRFLKENVMYSDVSAIVKIVEINSCPS